MAQKQFINFKDPVDSLPLSEKDLGIMRPGRYSGFDVVDIIGMTITLSHSSKIPKVNGSGDLITFGAFRTPRGVIIHEESSIALAIPMPGPWGGEFYCTILAEHNYQEIIGGNPATYQILIGPGPNYPPITDPTKQCVIGYIAGMITDIGTSMEYTPAAAPLLGDAEMAAYLANLPYASTGTPGLVRKATIGAGSSDPYSDTETYMSPRQVRGAGVTHTLNIGTLNSAVLTPGWVTQEITSIFGVRDYLMSNIKSHDVVWEETISGLKYFRGLKAGYYPVGGFSEGVGFPEPSIAFPQLRVDPATKKVWLIFWSKHNVNITGTQLVITRRLN